MDDTPATEETASPPVVMEEPAQRRYVVRYGVTPLCRRVHLEAHARIAALCQRDLPHRTGHRMGIGVESGDGPRSDLPRTGGRQRPDSPASPHPMTKPSATPSPTWSGRNSRAAASSSRRAGCRWSWSTSSTSSAASASSSTISAEKRVDFRELVKDLARYKTRIEMRQIGVRDEAKLLADYGDCGKPVCCNTHLTRNAAGLDEDGQAAENDARPVQDFRACGRLKCCLRYEYDTYEEHRKELPAVGATVVTRQGTGRVVAQELLAKKLIIAYEGQRTCSPRPGILSPLCRSRRILPRK